MKHLILLLFFQIFLTSTSHAGIIPIAARFDGVGGTYGLGYQQNFSESRLLVGAAGGDVQVYGLLYTNYLSKDLELSIGHLNFSGLSLLTTYNRGLTDDENARYVLNINGSATAIGSKWWLLDDALTFNFSTISSTVSFDDYQDEYGNNINLAGANLFDINTLNIKLGLDFNFYDNNRSPSSGFGFNTSVSNLSGRTGQSDQMIFDYGINGLIPTLSFQTLAIKAKISEAIVSVNGSYDTAAEIRSALGANCSSIADSTERTNCENLENELVDYILANNTRGTANPLGGSSGLRSFREQRFRAAHSALLGLELRNDLSAFVGKFSEGSRIEFNLFYDLGFANEDKTELFESSKYSTGAVLAYVKDSFAVRLTAAQGSDDTNSWSLGFGSSL